MRVRALTLCLMFGLAPARAVAQATPVRPGKEISLPPQEVRDSFFAFVIGILRSGIDVSFDGAAMRDVLTEFKTSLDLPFDLIDNVAQRGVKGSNERIISISFFQPASIPIPFSLLGYHPGSIRADRQVVFRVIPSTYPDVRNPLVSAPVFELPLEKGYLRIDVDEWLDILFGGLVDDMELQRLVFFTYRGDWMGLLDGTGHAGRHLRAYFNFRRNRIMFPVPGELEAVGAKL